MELSKNYKGLYDKALGNISAYEKTNKQKELEKLVSLGKKTKGIYRNAFMNLVGLETKGRTAKFNEASKIKNSGVRFVDDDETRYKMATNPALIDKREEIEHVNRLKSMISVDPKHSVFIGSSTYKVQKYPSDFDVFELTQVNSGLEGKIKAICNSFNDRDSTIFLELKAGFDIDYDITKKDIKYPDDIMRSFYSYYKKGLISRKDYSKIEKQLMKGPDDKCKEMNLFAALRNYLLLRWNINDVNKGYKMLSDGSKLTLSKALEMHTDVNIECAFIDLDGSIQDISNFYYLVKGDVFISAERDIVDSLKRSTFILTNNCYRSVNYFKAMKRMFSLCKYICLKYPVRSLEYQKYSKYLNKITLAIESDLNVLYYSFSKLKSTYEIYEKINADTPNNNNFIPSDYENTVSDVLHDINIHLANDKEAYPILVDTSLELINYFNGKGDAKKIEDGIDALLSIVNERTLMFMYKEGLATQNRKYTPIIEDFTNFSVDNLKTYQGHPYLPYIFNSQGKQIAKPMKKPIMIDSDYIGNYKTTDEDILKYSNKRSIDKYYKNKEDQYDDQYEDDEYYLGSYDNKPIIIDDDYIGNYKPTEQDILKYSNKRSIDKYYNNKEKEEQDDDDYYLV